MTNKQLAELLLVRLYEKAEKEGYSKLISLQELSKTFGEVDDQKVANAARYLQSLGLIDALFTESDEALSTITGKGSIFVEEGGKTGVINQYFHNPNFIMEQKNVNISGVKDSNINVGGSNVHQSISKNSIKEIESLILKMIDALESDKDLSDSEKQDFKIDIETLQKQLQKTDKDPSLIKRTIDILNSCKPLIPYVPPLMEALKPIFG
jgi:hypothetical protein